MKCKKCNKEFIPEKGLRNYCSLQCRNSRTWSEADKIKKRKANKGKKLSQETKDKISKSWTNKRKEAQKSIAKSRFTNKKASEETREKIRKANKDKKLSQETKDKISKKMKEFYKKHPEKHPNVRCANLIQSYPESFFEKYLITNRLEKNVDFIFNYPIRGYFVDYYFPKLNLGVEIDGEYWHDRSDDNEIYRENILKEEIELERFWVKNLLKKEYTKIIDNIISRCKE
jgi:very-short-patch-repair endonuclease